MSVRLSDPRPEAAELQTESPTPSRVWGDQWLRVSEKVIKGLNHQLTNRVASLDAVLTLLGDEDEVPDVQLMSSLAQEVKRLNGLLHLYRLMPAEPFVTTEPVRLQDVVSQVMELHGHHADLRGVPIEVDRGGDTAPVLVRPSALVRSLLVLLESAAGNALRAGSAGTLHVSYGGDADRVYVTFEAPCPPGQLLFTGDGSLVAAANSALAHAHGDVTVETIHGTDGERIRYTVVMPTLAAARRLGDMGAERA
jgi:hypothetical protein